MIPENDIQTHVQRGKHCALDSYSECINMI